MKKCGLAVDFWRFLQRSSARHVDSDSMGFREFTSSQLDALVSGKRRLPRLSVELPVRIKCAEREFEAVARLRRVDRVAFGGKLVSDRGANEIGAVGVEPFAHEQVDAPQVDMADVDRDLLGLGVFQAERDYVGHAHPPSMWMVYGC